MVIAALILLTIFAPASSAQTEVELGIKSSFADRIPLWLDRFAFSDKASKGISQSLEHMVLADLEFSGLFIVKRGRPREINQGGSDLEVVVRGIVGSEGKDYFFEGRVIDASNGRMIGGKRYQLREKLMRRIAHHFSDEVVMMLTGEKGISSSRILLVKKSEEKWEIVMSDYDGYNPKVLLRLSRPILNPRWIDESSALVYTSYLYGKPDLFIRKLNEASSKPLATFSGLNYSVDWSQKRKELLVTLSKDGNPEVYILSKDGKVKRRLTYNRAIDCSPSWSPSGREVLFTSDRSGTPQVYVMEADGSNVRRLTFLGNYNAAPAWSPKGDLIAFVSRINGYFQLCTIRPDGSDMRLITDEPVSHDSPRWAADGRHIVFTEEKLTGSLISIVDITTLGRRILSRGKSADWSMK